MPKCPRCMKEVYFAERVTSLGKDWHRPCLKCEKCSKTLTPGNHSEQMVKCLSLLSGPRSCGTADCRSGSNIGSIPQLFFST
ncbi:unnamed protein product [Echinostoma caproni]|uniref:Cysteine-rich protein 1 n=1 Tax=Echinostoma caproni TaxID=27848 RepID=A0A183A9W7_9TREM|nr:unnamed protein product [Echinostoma caproni]